MTPLLLHAAGWDEAILLGVGLLVGVAVVLLTGRRRGNDDAEDETEAGFDVDPVASDEQPGRPAEESSRQA